MYLPYRHGEQHSRALEGGWYRSPVGNEEVTLSLDPELLRRLQRVVQLGKGKVDLAGAARSAIARGLPMLESQAKVFAARNVDRCPRCRAARSAGGYRQSAGRMSSEDVGQARLQLCAECGGVWLDNASGQALMVEPHVEAVRIADEAASAAPLRGQRVGELGCPICERALTEQRLRYAELVVDLCAEHGTWFDAGELPKLLRAVKANQDLHALAVAQQQALEREAELVEMERQYVDSLMADGARGPNGEEISRHDAYAMAYRAVRGGY